MPRVRDGVLMLWSGPPLGNDEVVSLRGYDCMSIAYFTVSKGIPRTVCGRWL
jgi:hypothetical protein